LRFDLGDRGACLIEIAHRERAAGNQLLRSFELALRQRQLVLSRPDRRRRRSLGVLLGACFDPSEERTPFHRLPLFRRDLQHWSADLGPDRRLVARPHLPRDERSRHDGVAGGDDDVFLTDLHHRLWLGRLLGGAAAASHGTDRGQQQHAGGASRSSTQRAPRMKRECGDHRLTPVCGVEDAPPVNWVPVPVVVVGAPG
jgi:hypothetical protein